MKVVLEYDPKTDMIMDLSGVYIGTLPLDKNNSGSADDTKKRPIADIVALKDAGFTAEEIIELTKREVI